MTTMKAQDWTLLAIAAGKGRTLTPVQLQKSLFLLSKEYPELLESGFYQFTPYNYGPFDVRIYGDAERLSGEGLVELQVVTGRRWNEYSVTSNGADRAAALRREAPPEALAYLDRVVAWAKSLSFQQLVRAVYQKYPEYRANSVFQD